MTRVCRQPRSPRAGAARLAIPSAGPRRTGWDDSEEQPAATRRVQPRRPVADRHSLARRAAQFYWGPRLRRSYGSPRARSPLPAGCGSASRRTTLWHTIVGTDADVLEFSKHVGTAACIRARGGGGFGWAGSRSGCSRERARGAQDSKRFTLGPVPLRGGEPHGRCLDRSPGRSGPRQDRDQHINLNSNREGRGERSS